MIVVDTSVWIDYFNGRQTPQTETLDNRLQFSQVAIFDVILMEILQGFRNPKEYEQAKTYLELLPCFEILGKQNALSYAQFYRTLRTKGITIRKSNDVMIAGFCILHNLPLLFCDRDFQPFVEHLNLTSAFYHH